MAQQSYSGASTTDIGTPDLYWGTWVQGLLSEWWRPHRSCPGKLSS